MNRADKCEEILKKIITLVNNGRKGKDHISFFGDLSDGNCCILEYKIKDIGPIHSHFGGFSSSWNELVNELYGFLNKNDF